MNKAFAQRIAWFAAKAALSVVLIWFALRGIDSTTIYEQLRAVSGPAVALAVVVTTAISLLHAHRWQLILGRMGHRLRFAETLKYVLIGYFFNQTLPSTIGGDAFRAWGVYRLGIGAADAITSVIVDRIFALASLVVMIFIGSWWLFDLMRAPSARWVIGLVIASGVIGMFMLLSLARFSHRLPAWRVTTFLVNISTAARSVALVPAAATKVLLLTIGGYAALSYSVQVLAVGLGVQLGFGDSLLLVPLVTLVTVLPISIAGWGLRESAMVIALGLVGVSRVQAFSLSVLFGLVVMMSGVPGGLIWLWSRRHVASARG